jgi:hypothetical protein
MRSVDTRGLKMHEIILPVFVGVLLGLSFALVAFRLATTQQIKKAKENGMHLIYKEIVTKRKHSDYQYSEEAKRVMDQVHLSQILK